MKKIIYISLTILTIFHFLNEKNLKVNAETSYHFIENIDIEKDYCQILSAGYYIFINYENSLKNTIIGDANFETDIIPLSIQFTDYLEVDQSYKTNVEAMMNEVYTYFDVDLESGNNHEHYILIVEVKSYAVFITSTNLYHLEAFYVPTTTPNTDTTIAGSKTHIINIDNPLSIDEIKSRYTATDEVDGDITSSIIFTSNYTTENIKPINYYIFLSVSDKAGNTTFAADLIMVKDLTDPVTTIDNNEISIEVGTIFTSSDAMNLFTHSDNFSPSENLDVFFRRDDYKSNYSTVGDYYVEVFCYDEGGNSSVPVGLTIHIVDTQKPTLYLLDNTNRIETYEVLTDEQIKDLLVISDNYYSIDELTVEIIENTCDGSQGKDFTIKIKVTDPSNNSCIKEFFYFIYDTEKPIINVSNAIYIEYGTNLTNEQILDILKEVGLLTNEAETIEITNTETIDNITIITYTATLTNGEKIDGTFEINYYIPVNNKPNNKINFIILFSVIFIIGCGSYVFFKKHY